MELPKNAFAKDLLTKLNDGIETEFEFEFPDDIDKRFEEAITDSIKFRDLPLDDYMIISSNRLYSNKIMKDFLKITAISRKDKTKYNVITTERFAEEFDETKHKYFRNLGIKTSKKTGNEYFDFILV